MITLSNLSYSLISTAKGYRYQAEIHSLSPYNASFGEDSNLSDGLNSNEIMADSLTCHATRLEKIARKIEDGSFFEPKTNRWN